MARRTRVTFHPEVWSAISKTPDVRRATRQAAARIRTEARRLAPKDSGAGARSIAVGSYYDKATKTAGFKVTWSRDRFYLRFYNNGATRPGGRRITAQHFLEKAAERNQ